MEKSAERTRSIGATRVTKYGWNVERINSDFGAKYVPTLTNAVPLGIVFLNESVGLNYLKSTKLSSVSIYD